MHYHIIETWRSCIVLFYSFAVMFSRCVWWLKNRLYADNLHHSLLLLGIVLTELACLYRTLLTMDCSLMESMLLTYRLMFTFVDSSGKKALNLLIWACSTNTFYCFIAPITDMKLLFHKYKWNISDLRIWYCYNVVFLITLTANKVS